MIDILIVLGSSNNELFVEKATGIAPLSAVPRSAQNTYHDNVSLWKDCDVLQWLKTIGFEKQSKRYHAHKL